VSTPYYFSDGKSQKEYNDFFILQRCSYLPKKPHSVGSTGMNWTCRTYPSEDAISICMAHITSSHLIIQLKVYKYSVSRIVENKNVLVGVKKLLTEI
jgi:hypothetical protein